MGDLVWLASYPKSGSTWMRAFLHNYIREPAEPYDINSLMDFSIGESGAPLYRRHDPRPASQYSVADVQRMRPLVHRDLTTLHPDLVFVKTHNASLLVHGVPLVTPEVTAGAIYILRDPRDVAISFSQHAGKTIDEMIAFMAHPEAAGGGTDQTVYERFASWSIHVHFWTRNPNPRLLVLRYEDMVAEPETAFGGVIRFLGQEPPRARLERAIAFSSFATLSEQERARGFAERPGEAVAPFFRAGRAGQWREVLSATQSARIARDHATVMRRFGYLP
jgi:hypothetical protein